MTSWHYFPRIVFWVWLIFCAAAGAQDVSSSSPRDQPADRLALVEHSIRQIADPADPDFGLATRVEALSLLAQSAHALDDKPVYDRCITAIHGCINHIADDAICDEARWSLVEALGVGGRFDEAQKATDAVADPVTRALAQMSLAVAHAAQANHAEYQRLRDSAVTSLQTSLANDTNETDNAAEDDTGWVWLILVELHVQAKDSHGADGVIEQHVNHPAGRAAAFATVAEAQSVSRDTIKAKASLARALDALQRMEVMLESDRDLVADTDQAYAVLARAHVSLGEADRADKRLAKLMAVDLKAETLAACAVHLHAQGNAIKPKELFAQARALLDQPAHPLWINHWSWFEVSRHSTLAEDFQANARWIETLEDPIARALAELGVLRGLVEDMRE